MYEFLLCAGVVLWGGLCLWYLRHPAASAFHPVTFYLTFHGILFTLRPILAWTQDFGGIYRAYSFTPSMADKTVVLAAADLALVVFVVLALRFGNAPFLRPGMAPARRTGQRFTTALWVTFAVCLPVPLMALGSGVMIQAVGGGTMIRDAGTGLTINTTSNGYFTDSVLMLGPLAVLFVWAGRFRWWAWTPLLLFIVAKAGTGGRWPFIMAAMSAGLFWMYEHRLRWFPPRVVLAAVPLLAVFTIVGADRGAAVRAALLGGPQTFSTADYFHERPLESMDYGNLEFFEYLVRAVPAKTGTYDYFLNNLQILTEPVPRVLWPGKPVGAPIKRFNLWDYGTPIGMTFSVAGTGWLQAGWIGVVLWTALYAWLYGRGYQWFVRSDRSQFKTAAFMILTPVALQTFRDGVLLTVLKTSFFPLLPVLVWWGASRLFPSTPPAAAPVRRRLDRAPRMNRI
jgi:hypothetical protein